MRIDPNNWLKQVILINSDLLNTFLLIDLSQKLKCVHTDLMLPLIHAVLYQGWFYHAFMVDHAQLRSPALEFLNPCFKSFPTMSLTSFRHSLGKIWLLEKSVIGLILDHPVTRVLLREALHTPERDLDGSGLGDGLPRHNHSFMLATDDVHVAPWLDSRSCPSCRRALSAELIDRLVLDFPPSTVFSSVGMFRSLEQAMAEYYGFSSSGRVDEDFLRIGDGRREVAVSVPAVGRGPLGEVLPGRSVRRLLSAPSRSSLMENPAEAMVSVLDPDTGLAVLVPWIESDFDPFAEPPMPVQMVRGRELGLTPAGVLPLQVVPVAESVLCNVCLGPIPIEEEVVSCSAGCAGRFCLSCLRGWCNSYPAPHCLRCHNIQDVGGVHVQSLDLDSGSGSRHNHSFLLDDEEEAVASWLRGRRCPCCNRSLSPQLTAHLGLLHPPSVVVGPELARAVEQSMASHLGFSFAGTADADIFTANRRPGPGLVWVSVPGSLVSQPVARGEPDPVVVRLLTAPRRNRLLNPLVRSNSTVVIQTVTGSAAVPWCEVLFHHFSVPILRQGRQGRRAGGRGSGSRSRSRSRGTSRRQDNPSPGHAALLAIHPAAASPQPLLPSPLPASPLPLLPTLGLNPAERQVQGGAPDNAAPVAEFGQTPPPASPPPLYPAAEVGTPATRVEAAPIPTLAPTGATPAVALGPASPQLPAHLPVAASPAALANGPPVPIEGDLLHPQHPMWRFIQGLTPEQVLRHPTLTTEKKRGSLVADAAWKSAVEFASKRAGASDIDAVVDSQRLFLLLPALIFGKFRVGDEQLLSTTPWADTILSRVTRLLAGEIEGLFEESILAAPGGGGGRGQQGRDRVQDAKAAREQAVKRSIDFCRRGQPSKALGALSSTGMLDTSNPDVQEAYSRLQDPHGDGEGDVPVQEWKTFVQNNGAAYPNLLPVESELYKFQLGVTLIHGADGTSREVDTLEHVLQNLDSTSAPGASSMSFALLKKLGPDVLRPLLQPYFGRSRWDYSRPCHRETHALLVSVRALGLDKTGLGRVEDLRPIGIGEALRRLAHKCWLLQEGEGIGRTLALHGQFGCGFKNGSEVIHRLTTSALEALYERQLACASSETDARNAYCSIFRSAIQRGIAKHAPGLLPFFDFLYGPQALAQAFFYSPGNPAVVGSCLLPSGVHQGCVLGPLFFSLGLDELLQQVRGVLANLPVDSTMVGQSVKVQPGAVFFQDGAVSPFVPHVSDTFVLLAAPEFPEEDPSSRVIVSVLPGGVAPEEGDDFFCEYSVPWEAVRLSRVVLLSAYLDDIRLTDELFLSRPFMKALQELGPSIGLLFDKRAKNYLYVPLPFLHHLQAMYPNAVVVTDESPGDNPSDQLKLAAVAYNLSAPENASRPLVTTCGVERVMGSPIRLVETDPLLGLVSINWIASQVDSAAQTVGGLFAHIGVPETDRVALEGGHFPLYVAGEDVPKLPVSEPQLQHFLARTTLPRRLNHLARTVSPAATSASLRTIDHLLQATAAGLMGLRLDALTPPQRERLTLPTRFAGTIPGAALTTAAQFLNSAVEVRRTLVTLVGNMGLKEIPIPPVLSMVLDDASERWTQGGGGVVPASFRSLTGALAEINAARADQPGEAGVQLTLQGLMDSKISTRDLAEPILASAVRRIANTLDPDSAGLMEAGRIPGANGLVSAIPSVPAFTVSPSSFRFALLRQNGHLPMLVPHPHHCGERGVRMLGDSDGAHIFSCPCLGGQIRPHDEVKFVLAHLIKQCGVTSTVPMTEVRVRLRSGGSWYADLQFMDQHTGQTIVIGVSVVNTDSATESRRGGGATGSVVEALRRRAREKRALPAFLSSLKFFGVRRPHLSPLERILNFLAKHMCGCHRFVTD